MKISKKLFNALVIMGAGSLLSVSCLANAHAAIPKPEKIDFAYDWVIAARNVTFQQCTYLILANKDKIDGVHIKDQKCAVSENTYNYMQYRIVTN